MCGSFLFKVLWPEEEQQTLSFWVQRQLNHCRAEVAFPPPSCVSSGVRLAGRCHQKSGPGLGCVGIWALAGPTVQFSVWAQGMCSLGPCIPACCCHPCCSGTLEALTVLASASLLVKWGHHRLSHRFVRTRNCGQPCWVWYWADDSSTTNGVLVPRATARCL